MKTLLFCLLPFSLFAQRGETVKDSAYTELIAGKYYSVRVTVYENGEEAISKTPIGTASDVYRAAKDRYTQNVATMASDARIVSLFGRRLTEMKRENEALKTLISLSPLDSIQKDRVAPFLLAGWVIREDAGSRNVVFTVNASGQMRYKIGTDALKNAVLYGDIITMKDFPASGVSTDLYRLENGNYAGLNRRYVLRQPGSSQNTARDTATPEDTAPVIEPVITTPKKKKKKQ